MLYTMQKSIFVGTKSRFVVSVHKARLFKLVNLCPAETRELSHVVEIEHVRGFQRPCDAPFDEEGACDGGR